MSTTRPFDPSSVDLVLPGASARTKGRRGSYKPHLLDDPRARGARAWSVENRVVAVADE
jgi:hypothetical protein